MPAEVMSPKNTSMAEESLAAKARVMIPTPKNNTPSKHSCRVSRCGCVAPDGIGNRSPRYHARFCPYRCDETRPANDEAQAVDDQIPFGRDRSGSRNKIAVRVPTTQSDAQLPPPPPPPMPLFGRARGNSRSRSVVTAPTTQNGAHAGEAQFRSKAPASLDTHECDVAFDAPLDVVQPQPSPSANELTDTLLGKTEDLLRRLSELGLDAIKTPNGLKDIKIDEIKDTASEDDCSEKVECVSQDDEQTDQDVIENKRDTVEVPIELWKMMQEKFKDAITTESNCANEMQRLVALQRLQDTIANEWQSRNMLRKNSRGQVYDDMLASTSSLAPSTDCPGTDTENESNSSSEVADNLRGVAIGAPRSSKDHVSRSVRATSPARLTVTQPLRNVLSPHFKPAAIHVLRRQSSPLGLRVLSPSPRRVGPRATAGWSSPRDMLPRATVGWSSPRDTLTSTTVSQTVNVTTSIQSSGGSPLSVTTNVQTSTRVDFSARI